MDFIVDFFTNNFQNCVWLAVILVACCPLLESKIAIPLAMNSAIWGSQALSPLLALSLSFLGSILPCYLTMFIVRKMKNKTSGFFISNFFHRYDNKSLKIKNTSSLLKKYFILTTFVAIPLPMTGVWTGSVIAGLTNLNLNYSFLAITAGALISSCAITLLCSVFTNSISYILMISLIIIIVFLFIDLFIHLIKRKK